MSRNQAFCYFCSKPDDSIQVICLSRCLVCSRCQLVPSIRKLLLDHCEIIPASALHSGVSNAVTTGTSASGTGSKSNKNNGKFADGYMSSTMNQIVRETSTNTILYLPNTFINNVNAINSSSANTTLLNSSNMMDDAISTLRQSTSNHHLNSSNTNNFIQMCMRGTCPICGVHVSVGMLQIILEYKEAQKAQAEEEASGKSSANFELEETSALIPNFLKRYRSTYEAAKEKEAPPLDPADPFSILNANASSANNSSGNLSNSKESGSNKKNNNNANLADPMDALNVPPKQTLQTMLEFLIDCYCGQLQNMLKNGNDSMLTVMMRQAIRKKFSQKTNDYKIKSLIDYMIAPTGSENAEMILFCHLIGLQPKPTIKLSAGWSHIATTIIACALCEKATSTNTKNSTTPMDGIASSPIPTTIEFRNKMTKYLATNGNLGRSVGAKRAAKLINTLFSIRQPYWVMAPVTSQCIEYQCRLPWCRESMSKLFNILLFVMLYEEPAQSNHPTTPGPAMPTTPGNGPTVSTKLSRASSRDIPVNTMTGSNTPNQGQSRRNTGVFTTEGNNSIGTTSLATSRGGGGSLSRENDSNPATASGARSRRATENSTFWKTMFNGSVASNGNNTTGKGSSRMEMLKSLDPIIEKMWNSFAHPFLKIPRPSAVNGSNNNAYSHYDSLMINPYQGLIDYFANLDDLASSSTPSTECFYIDCDEDQFLRIAESASLSISIHELSLVLIRCWEAEYSHVRQALVKSIITAQRRTGIVGSYDAKQASMTATERLAITRLLHFYRTEDESNKLEMKSNPPKPIFGLGNRPYYPGLYQFRGIDWDEVEVNVNRKYYPFAIPFTLLTKSRVELNTLSEQVTDMILTQQIKDIEDDLQWKARIAKEEEDNKLPDIAEIYHESTPLDSEEESDEESRQFIAKFMQEGATGGGDGVEKPSLKQAKENYKRIRALNRQNGGDKNGLVDKKAVLSLESNLPTNAEREAFQNEKGTLTPGGLVKGSLTPARPLSAAATAALRSANQSRPNSAYPKNALDTVYHTKDGQVSFVEIIDNDAEVLEQTHLVTRPKSGLASARGLSSRQRQDGNPLDRLASYPSGVDPQPLEVVIKEIPPPEQHKLPLSVSGRRTTPHHDVRIEKDREGNGNKIFVNDEIFQHPSKNASRGGVGTPATTTTTATDADNYQKTMEDFKRVKVMEARSKILNRVNSSSLTHSDSATTISGDDPIKSKSKAKKEKEKEKEKDSGDKESKGECTSANVSNSGKNNNAADAADADADADDDYRRHFNSADVLGAFGRATTAGSSSYHQRHRIEPYLNLAKHINGNGQLVLERDNNLITESAIQYLTLQNANITIQTLQEICSIFMKEWQIEYMKVIDLSGNPQLSTLGMKLFCNQFKSITKCHLIHLNLNHMNIGDSGLKTLLKALHQSGNQESLLQLDLQKNQLTFASDAISMLSNFKKLKSLDLSHNYFTLDTSMQMKYFETGIKDCQNLTLLSVAFNKIQDRGFAHIINVISKYQLPVKALDVAGCFLTNTSSPVLYKVLKACPPVQLSPELDTLVSVPPLPLLNTKPAAPEVILDDQGNKMVISIEKLFLHKNLFGVAMWETITVEYQPGSSCRLQYKDPYTGIAVMPCYNLRDYGIIAPSIHSFIHS